ncbi:MAG: hypothetical protein AAFV98_22740 [Chloroflexota bacterium]
MSIAVEAKHQLEAYLLDAEIMVTIPAGTTGELVREMTKAIVVVKFNVPSLGALRVQKQDLLMHDSLEALVRDMQGVLDTKPAIAPEMHKAGDELLLRALEFLATEETANDVSQLVALYKKIPRHSY